MNKQNIYHYLMIQGDVDKKTDMFIDECINEVKKHALFKCIHAEVHLSHTPLKIDELDLMLESEDLKQHLGECREAILIACTLGSEVDRKLKYYQLYDMGKAVIFDAVCNAYIEECTDAYEENLNLKKRTFRLCPGYGDIPLKYNQDISKYLNIEKHLRVTINEGGLFVPLKTMVGIIGLGVDSKKTCLTCVNMNTCQLRNEGKTCYVKK